MQNFFSFLKGIKSEFEENHKVADFIFTVIIMFVSLTSFFHVMEYWTLTNKAPFYVITAIATELFILGSMLAIRYTSVAWIPFIFGIIVQGIGNIFYSYINIQVESVYFIAFQELFKPMFEIAYGDELELANYKRVLAYSNGLFYLSPIVFLWAKLSLKSQTKNLNTRVKPLDDNDGGNTPPVQPEDDLGDIKITKQIEPESAPVEGESPSEVVVEKPTTVINEFKKNRGEILNELREEIGNEISSPTQTTYISPSTQQQTENEVVKTKRTFSFNPATPTVEKKRVEKKQEDNDGIQVWTDILHEVARDSDPIQDEEPILKVRDLKRPVGEIKITDKFTIAGLKPENK
jgi:hypothetical protein